MTIRTPKDRYDAIMRKVVKADNGCWLYIGWLDKDGYGAISKTGGGAKLRVHRFIYEYITGEILTSSELVLHHCDIPNCCNPKCLYKGNQVQNVNDRVKRNRSADNGGENNPGAKINWADVYQIRTSYASGESKQVIADKFNISIGQVYYIATKRSWKD